MIAPMLHSNRERGRAELQDCSFTGKPATSTFIPPLVDSLLLDYQSPRAKLGFYPNEVPAASQRRRQLLQVADVPLSRIVLNSQANPVRDACLHLDIQIWHPKNII